MDKNDKIDDTLQNRSNLTSKFFDKIKNSNLLTNIMIFLKLSNIKILIFVNKRLRNHLLKNDSKELRRLGNFTYGLDKYIEFSEKENDIKKEIKIKSIKSNLFPVEHMVLMNNLDLIASSPGTYNEGILFWRQSTGIFEGEIKYKNYFGDKGFVCCLCYIPDYFTLVASFTDGDIIAFDMSCMLKHKNENKIEPLDFLKFILWSKNIGSQEEPVKKVIYAESKGKLITLEQCIDLQINFIKIWDLKTGEHFKSSVVSNSIITSLKCFDIMVNKDIGLETFLIFGLSDGKIALKNFDQVESGYTEILPNYYLYGHECSISDFLYIQLEDRDILISCGQDLYIFFWDVLKKIAISMTDTLHEDLIVNMCQINEKIFATCGKDRFIILWSTYDCSHIQTFNYHTSTINCIQYNFEMNELFSASYDKFIRSVSFTENFKEVRSMRIINGHIGSITSAQLDFANDLFITASTDKTIKFWDIKKMQLIKSIETKNEFFDDFIILYDDFNTLVKIDLTKKIKCMDTKTGKFYQTLDEVSPARSILNLYDAVSFLVGLSNSEISYYNYQSLDGKNKFKKKKILFHGPEEGRIETSQSTESSQNNQCTTLPLKNLKIKKLTYINLQEKIVASGASDGSVCIFYLKDQIKKFIPSKIKAEVDCICPINYTGKEENQIFAYSVGDQQFIYNLLDMTLLMTLNLGKLSAVDRLNNNYLIFSTCVSNMINIMDLKRFKIIIRNQISYKGVSHIIYMKDGSRVIVLNGDNSSGFSMDILNFQKQ